MGKRKFLLFLIITEIFLVINEPYALRWILPLPKLVISAVFYLVFLFLMLIRKGKIRQLPQSVSVAFIITILVWFIYFIYFSDTSYITRIILLVVTFLFLMCINNEKDFYRFWKYNNRFILIQAILATICFVLVGVGVLKPLITIIPDGSYRQFYFFVGSFSKSYYGNVIRPSGFLDEPGALAAWAVFAILFNYAFIKDRIIKKYLPYCTLSTLSVAYFVQLGVYLATKNIRKIYKLVPIALFLFFSIWTINITKGTSFDIYERTVGRFVFDEETFIVGNSRQSYMDNAKQLFQKSPIVGVGAQNMGRLDEKLNDNPYEILAKDGIIGYIISYLPLIFILFINRKKEVLVCLIVLFIGYQQRPLHVNFMHDMYIWSFFLFAVFDARRQKLYKQLGYKRNETLLTGNEVAV